MSRGDRFDARGRSPGFELFQDLPDYGSLTSGPWRARAFAHDPRVASRSAHALTCGSEPAIHSARHRTPAIVADWAEVAAQYVTTPGDLYTRPADSSEALAWRELARVAELPDVLPRTGDGFAVQLLELEVPQWAGVVVERVATYLDVQALDDEGEPIGDRVRTAEFCCSDPFPEFVHPTTGTELRFRWALLAVKAGDPPLVFGSPASHVPTSSATQILQTWDDLRFAWGSRYSTDLRLVVPAGASSIRLYAIAEETGPLGASPWRVRVGGRLGVWWIGGGPRGRALAAVSERS